MLLFKVVIKLLSGLQPLITLNTGFFTVVIQRIDNLLSIKL